MKPAISIISVLLLAVFFASQPAYSWECSVEMDGPDWVKIGRTIELSASGLPAGGYYSWSSTANLVPNGSTATLTGSKPRYSDYISVTVRYTAPKGNSCSDSKWIYAHGCDVWFQAPAEAKLGEPVLLTANADPAGGSYQWKVSQGTGTISGNGATVSFTGDHPGEVQIEVTYTRPEGGEPCVYSQTILANNNCSMLDVSGPVEAKEGEAITLAATAKPAGGTYQWTITSGTGTIISYGSSAVFTGDQPGDVKIKVVYTPPEGGDPCVKYHAIRVKEKCSVTIQSDVVDIALGGTVNLQAVAMPPDGVYQWGQVDGLIPYYSRSLAQSDSALFTPQTAGKRPISIKYITPDGQECFDSHSVTAYKVESMVPKAVCYDSGTRLQQTDFDLLTTPTGYEDRIEFIPTTASTIFQSDEITVVGSCREGDLDDASSVILVVNKNNKDGISLDFKIPNYVNDALNIIGVGEKADLTFTGGFSKFMECCSGTSVVTSKSGSTTIGLSVDGGPFTIIGVPMPPVLNKYLSLKALAVTVSCDTTVAIDGDFAACQGITKWTGSGDITAGVEAKGEAKVIAPGKIIIIQGAVSGSTSVTEKMTVSSQNILLSGNWNGLIAKGIIQIKIRKHLNIKKEVSKSIMDSSSIPQKTIPLPFLN